MARSRSKKQAVRRGSDDEPAGEDGVSQPWFFRIAVSGTQALCRRFLTIYDVNKRLANVLAWLRTSRPDVACLQELKCTDKDFPVGLFAKAGYDAVWRGQRSWNGVAILGRGREPVPTRAALPGDPTDVQSRYLEAAVGGVLIATLYAPNGNPQPGPK